MMTWIKPAVEICWINGTCGDDLILWDSMTPWDGPTEWS
jgi:hypothetical protein